MTFYVRPEVTETAFIQDTFSQFAESLEVGVKPILDVNMAIQEIFSAFINHGDNLSTKRVVISFRVRRYDLLFTIAAEGPPYRKTDHSGMPSGMGKQLCYEYMDDIKYEHKHGQNILTLRKHYDIS